MPISYTTRPKIGFFSKIKEDTLRVLNYFTPETILVILLIVAIIMGILEIETWGYYLVVVIFIIGYFTERCVRLIKRKPPQV
jgi:hypothetical protein